MLKKYACLSDSTKSGCWYVLSLDYHWLLFMFYIDKCTKSETIYYWREKILKISKRQKKIILIGLKQELRILKN
jgi:ADP-heptose:LPS heptosyltransferase